MKNTIRCLSLTTINGLFNNNIVQYSAYLVVQGSIVSRIESMIFTRFDVQKEQLKCLLHDSREVYTFNVTYMYRTSQSDIRKIVCVFDEDGFQVTSSDQVGVAVIVETDFTINMNEVNNERYPYDLINYQTPDRLEIHEPRIPDVGVCLQYVSRIYPGILDWLKLHKEFKVAEIVMYDGSHDLGLKSLVGDQFDSVKIYDKYTHGPTCDYPAIQSYKSEFPAAINIYLKKCANSFLSVFGNNEKRNQMSSNDCYTKFSYKYEFVTLYDLDELIIPRRYNSSKLAELKHTCGDSKPLCELNPVPKMYDYLQNLIKEAFQHPISSLRSVEFPHAPYFIGNNDQTSLMNKLKVIANQIESNTTDKYPLKVPILTNGETFVIQEADKDYVLFLTKSYESFMCYYDAHLKNIQGYNTDMARFLYYVTPYTKRFQKSIFYTKNVYAIFTHEPIFFNASSIVFNTPWIGGHVNAHFRLDLHDFFRGSSETSIRKLMIDIEYTAFLLKKFTTFC